MALLKIKQIVFLVRTGYGITSFTSEVMQVLVLQLVYLAVDSIRSFSSIVTSHRRMSRLGVSHNVSETCNVEIYGGPHIIVTNLH